MLRSVISALSIAIFCKMCCVGVNAKDKGPRRQDGMLVEDDVFIVNVLLTLECVSWIGLVHGLG